MIESYYLYNLNYYVGMLSYDTENNEYSFVKEGNGKYVDRAIRQMSLDCGSEAIECAISERVFPEERLNASELLALLGMEYYHMWTIFKKINGINQKDTLWISKEKNNGEWFWNNHPHSEFARTFFLQNPEELDD